MGDAKLCQDPILAAPERSDHSNSSRQYYSDNDDNDDNVDNVDNNIESNRVNGERDKERDDRGDDVYDYTSAFNKETTQQQWADDCECGWWSAVRLLHPKGRLPGLLDRHQFRRVHTLERIQRGQLRERGGWRTRNHFRAVPGMRLLHWNLVSG